MSQLRDEGLRAFSGAGYEIVDDDLASRREVTIWSVNPMIPRIGDVFIVESRGVVHDVVVIELTTFIGGGWSARTRVIEAYS